MRLSLWIAALAILLCAAGTTQAQRTATAPSSAPATTPDPDDRAPVAFKTDVKPWTGDLEAMLNRRIVRVVAPYSRTLYYTDRGRERGLAVELVRDFERHLNKKYAKKLGRRPLTFYVFPATREEMLQEVAAGLADIAVGNLTITDERLQLVDMVVLDPKAKVREVLLSGPQSTPLDGVESLSGRTVHVRKSSSYYQSLVALNERFRREDKLQVKLSLVPDSLEDEDLMELLNAGLMDAIVVDDWKAKMWTAILPKIVVQTDIVLRDDGQVGWAIRKGSTQLGAELRGFFDGWVKTSGVEPYRLQAALKRMKQVRDPARENSEQKRFNDLLALFKTYGSQYDFDPLMLVAQGYQESQLDQSRRSHAGAIGVMQLMPATGASMKVGDVKQIEPNIHAGAKYMNHLMERYFADASFRDQDRTLFAFAAYNCGPGNIAKARAEAVKRGLDPNRWFNHVEIVIADRIGMETTTYVRNIFKYYVAYKLLEDMQAQVALARENMVFDGP